jgi:hypothetical protein
MPGGEFGGAGTGMESAANRGIDVSMVNVDPPTGPGWVIELRGYHFYNSSTDQRNTGAAHVRNTLMRNLEHGTIELPLGPGMGTDRFTMDELGIGYVILAWDNPINRRFKLPNPNYVGTGTAQGSFGAFDTPMGIPMPMPMPMGVGAKDEKKAPEEQPFFEAPRYDFIVQFVWQEKPLAKRYEERKIREDKAKAEAEAAAAAAAAAPPTDGTAPANGAAPVNGVAPQPGTVPQAGAVPPAGNVPAGAAPDGNAPGAAAPAVPPAGVAPGAAPAAPGDVPPAAAAPGVAPAPAAPLNGAAPAAPSAAAPAAIAPMNGAAPATPPAAPPAAASPAAPPVGPPNDIPQ